MFQPFFLLAFLPSLALGYSFNIASTPRQCQNLTIDITGTGGQPPYSALIIPFGPSPLANAIEARRITTVSFNGTNATSATFELKYPENSQFVVIASDSSGFGTGGTSTAATVLSGDSSSCFNSTTSVSPAFVFSIAPANQLVTCSATRIYWDNSTVEGIPTFQGVIPGGQSFDIPQGSLTTVASEGLGFNWTPSVRTGTTLLLVGGDNRGLGSAGSVFYIVSQGTSTSCLNDTSPSSTPGSPAGGSYPTSTEADTSGGSTTHHTNVGAIVGKFILQPGRFLRFSRALFCSTGGVLGGIVGVVALLLLLLFFRRRSTFQQSQKERPVDLLQDQDQDQDDGSLPQYYQPDPFVVPDLTASSSVGDGADAEASVAGLRPSTDRRQSRLSATTAETSFFGLRATTPDASASTSISARKSPVPPSFRPVNIIQHDDAGPPVQSQEEPETIELPPAYTNIRRGPQVLPFTASCLTSACLPYSRHFCYVVVAHRSHCSDMCMGSA
ncbi:hypothetical protein A0H81_12403 [Grifola frondosa]|uniref:Uncharacterized protein n=1 Tax=Grifola frondosa TaxID=5627 RepID=A0A1C7LXP1_GRIFR|nr:hypothetical protein A0H81_12403 [Grifola frondosa]